MKNFSRKAAVAVLFLVLVVPASAQTVGVGKYPGFHVAEGDFVQHYSDSDLLLDSRFLTIAGRVTEKGGCEFGFPVLTLEPDEDVIHARQVATNFTQCITLIEMGMPLDDAEGLNDEIDGTSESVEARPDEEDPSLDGRIPTKASASAYYRVYWEDVINLKVTETKSNISWSYNGSCVTSASGSLNTWWLSGTGWSKYSSNSYISSGCASRKVYSDAIFKNGAFCWPGTVWNYNYDVTVQGTATNGLSGWVSSTYTTYPFACPTLHYHTQLKRVTG